MKNLPISLYNGVKDNAGTEITTGDAIKIIGSDELINQVYSITHEMDAKKKSAIKSKLPAVTWSGTFSKRKAESLVTYTGLICLDFDKLSSEKIDSVKNHLPVFVYTAFRSPSGNGLKIICKLATGPAEHAENFRALANFFKIWHEIEADESGKDVCRLCFLSWDLGIYVNENCEQFYIPTNKLADVKKQSTQKPAALPAPLPLEKSITEKFEDLRKFTDKKVSYTENNYNRYVNMFAMNCKQRGIDIESTKSYCANAFHDYVEFHSLKALISIINSVYENTKFTFGKYARQQQPAIAQAKPTTPKDGEPGSPDPYKMDVLFWYETKKVDKETGVEKVEVKFDHDGLTWFMANNGYRKLKLGEKGFQFVRTNGNLLEALEPDELNTFIMRFLQQGVSANLDGLYTQTDIDDDLRDVRRMYMRGINNYSKPAIYSSLPSVEPKFLRDTEAATFLYFKNGFVEITAEKIELKPYENLKANIWSKQKKEFNVSVISKEDMVKGDTWQFINAAIIGEGANDEKDAERVKSMVTTLGYLIDSFKDPTNAKCVIFGDKEINRTGTESHGGSGKTLMAHFVGKMVNSCILDGKAFRFEDPYPFETLKPDHKMIVFNDVVKKFPFEQLFHKITEDFEYRKKYVDAITIPFEDSPKPLIITNYTISGEGSSFRRRQQFIEFSNYFDDEHTPKIEFGHRFFYDWDSEEWNRYYNTMFYCVQQYKKRGLVTFPAANIKLNKLLQASGETFIDWMDEKLIPENKDEKPIYLEEKLDRAKIFEKFREECRDYHKMENSNTFTSWVKMWCEVREYELNKHKNGGKDKSGATYYWTFTRK